MEGNKTTLLGEEQGQELQGISCQKPCILEESEVKYLKHRKKKTPHQPRSQYQ